MDNILIVSDNALTNSALETALRNAHFPIGIISVLGILAMIGGASYLAKQYNFLLLVIDTDFKKRFGCVITEMSAAVRNYSNHTPLYLIFADDYDPAFFDWLPHSKRLFQSIANQSKLESAIKEILQLEATIKN